MCGIHFPRQHSVVVDCHDHRLGPYRSSPSRAQQCLRSVQDHILHIPLYPHIVAYTPVGARYGPPSPAGESIASLPTEITSGDLQYTFTDLVVYWLKGISQVFLVNSWITGIFFIVGLALCSRWAAFGLCSSAAVALFMAIFFGASHPRHHRGSLRILARPDRHSCPDAHSISPD